MTTPTSGPRTEGGAESFLDVHYSNLRVLREFGFDDKQLAWLARNSFDACFAPEADKARWKAEVDSWLAAQAISPTEVS
jgi:adenosine deaminase